MNEDQFELVESAMEGVRVVLCGECNGLGQTLEGVCGECDGYGQTTTDEPEVGRD